MPSQAVWADKRIADQHRQLAQIRNCTEPVRPLPDKKKLEHTGGCIKSWTSTRVDYCDLAAGFWAPSRLGTHIWQVMQHVREHDGSQRRVGKGHALYIGHDFALRSLDQF